MMNSADGLLIANVISPSKWINIKEKCTKVAQQYNKVERQTNGPSKLYTWSNEQVCLWLATFAYCHPCLILNHKNQIIAINYKVIFNLKIYKLRDTAYLDQVR